MSNDGRTKLFLAPTEEPLTVEQVKDHLRVDGTDQDIWIEERIVAAREYCEGFQNRAYITQTWDLYLDWFSCGDCCIKIPKPPLVSVTSITYLDTAGVSQTLAASTYKVDTVSELGRIALAYGQSWPSTYDEINTVVIRFVAGYGAAAAVPKRVTQAMYLLIGHWFENRETVLTGTISKEVEFSVESLLWQERVVPI